MVFALGLKDHKSMNSLPIPLFNSRDGLGMVASGAICAAPDTEDDANQWHGSGW